MSNKAFQQMGYDSSRKRSQENDSDTEEADTDSGGKRDDTDGRQSRGVARSESDASVQRSTMRASKRSESKENRGSTSGYVDYETGPDRQALSERYGMDVREGVAGKLQRLESEFGSDRVSRWAEEGMPVETMGKPRDMQAFRKRQEKRPEAVPTDIERRNEASAQRNAARNRQDGSSGETGVPDVVRSVVSSPGKSLDKSVQREMESKIGGDFGDVQLHTGPKAAAAADSINARAFTVGNHVAFNKGEYQPDSDSGKKVLAHELTHVRQQTSGKISMLPKSGADEFQSNSLKYIGKVQPKLEISSPEDPAEKEAERVAEKVVQMDESNEESQQNSPKPTEVTAETAHTVQRQSSEASSGQETMVFDEEEAKAVLEQEETDQKWWNEEYPEMKESEGEMSEEKQRRVNSAIQKQIYEGNPETGFLGYVPAQNGVLNDIDSLLSNRKENVRASYTGALEAFKGAISEFADIPASAASALWENLGSLVKSVAVPIGSWAAGPYAPLVYITAGVHGVLKDSIQQARSAAASSSLQSFILQLSRTIKDKFNEFNVTLDNLKNIRDKTVSNLESKMSTVSAHSMTLERLKQVKKRMQKVEGNIPSQEVLEGRLVEYYIQSINNYDPTEGEQGVLKATYAVSDDKKEATFQSAYLASPNAGKLLNYMSQSKNFEYVNYSGVNLGKIGIERIIEFQHPEEPIYDAQMRIRPDGSKTVDDPKGIIDSTGFKPEEQSLDIWGELEKASRVSLQ